MMDVVTGGAGFIGSHLIRRLIASGRDVRVIDDLSTGRRDRLDGAGTVDFVRADLATADLAPLVRDASRVFHLAAIPSVTRSVRDPITTHRAAATATLRLLLACRDAGVRRVVLSSSSSVYGESRVELKSEDVPPDPISPYGVSKLAAEGYARAFARLFGLETVNLRYFNVFGPGQDPSSEYAAVIPLFVTRALAGETLRVHGDGEQTRDFTYVENVVLANEAAATVPCAPGSTYNIAAGNAHSILDLIGTLERILDRRLSVSHGPPRPGDIRHSRADIRKAGAELGWRPTVGFEEGLRRVVDSYRAMS